ncbi:hypothetical protein BDW02DRAFT_565133 [Decorospora gaudefroyi]|uniref:Fungal N-terminal domain-containing protein n=1 Tax=Decorospora gaudefroyi TaxID=184978 RepID=A0A6A5KQK8_9PLEO|nr:hypothetical protein BDW02DRAFT_565133 [Decorospora gaudefroyi]
MALLAAILPVVSRSSTLALELYMLAAASPDAANELIRVASAINGFALILKQVGTIIKEDDRLPSPEAIKTLDDVMDQSQSVLTSFESTTSIQDEQHHHDRRDSARFPRSERSRPDPPTEASLEYLVAHLETLSMTLSVMLQTLYTAQSIMWSKLRPTVSPQQAAKAVANEKVQLETLIIQQQLAILSASNSYHEAPRPDARLLMEADSSQSLMATERGDTSKPSSLHPYQDPYLAGLDISASTEAGEILAICSISASHADRLLERWTSLRQFESRLQDEERELRRQRQETQQATVESDSEEEQSRSSKLSGDGARRTRRSESVQPLFTQANSASIPIPEKHHGHTAPPTPAATPRTSHNNIPASATDQYRPSSPRSSVVSLPVEAAAAVEAKEEDSEVNLEIPWVLCTRKYYWRFIDAKQVSSNTEQTPSLAFLERNSWTEIMASWVTKEAIREAGYRFTQVQKDVQDGRRTKLETCFCIEPPLQFDQVKKLVERTVEMYRKTAPPTPPPSQTRRSSFQRPPPASAPKSILKGISLDRDRTPVTRTTHPPLDRANSSMHFPPPPPGGPPPLDRSLSMPGPGLVPPLPQSGINSRTPNLQIPVPPMGHYVPPQPPRPQSPRLPQYTPQPMTPAQQQWTYPPPPLPSNALPFMNSTVQQSPLRNLYANSSSSYRKYEDDFTTSESEAERPRRRRSKSRSRYSYEKDRDRDKKKSHIGTKAAAGALLGVGGLTALLDGLSGL